ncbi:MAG: hypothetical protein Q7T32_06255 [Moraxellaceae bacterium]|nr:hypothetical protein [Moraxellaceae bacterium]
MPEFLSFAGHFYNKHSCRLFSMLLAAMTATTAMAGEAPASCSPNFSDYKVGIWAFTSPPNTEQDPNALVYAPSGYKVLGGGAIVHTLQGNAFLTASYPEVDSATSEPTGWTADSKHLGTGTRARITVYVIAVNDPSDCWSVQAFQQSSTTAVAHPAATVTLGAGYVLTGGGARATPATSGGNGNFLFSSIPYASGGGSTYNGWAAQSKDHGISDVANITAFAIGIKAAGAGVNTPTSNVFSGKPSTLLSNPSAFTNGYNGVLPGINCTMTGGGAYDNWGNAYGNLLTAIYPIGTGAWQAFAQSYGQDNPSVLTAYAVCLN